MCMVHAAHCCEQERMKRMHGAFEWRMLTMHTCTQAFLGGKALSFATAPATFVAHTCKWLS